MDGSKEVRILRGRRIVPDLLTMSRPVLGAAAGAAVAWGQGGLGGWLYLLGYLTDVADGLVARALHVDSPQGQRLDGICDLIAMYGIGLGLLARAVLDGAWVVVAILVAATAGGHVLDRRWIPAHTVVGKAIGGATRVATLALFILFAPAEQRLPLVVAGSVIFVSTFLYEGEVTRRELHSGERPIR